jgi:hypothetical protein
MRENGLWNGVGELNASNAGEVKIPRGTPTPLVTPEQVQVEERSGGNLWLMVISALTIILILLIALKKIQNRATI